MANVGINLDDQQRILEFKEEFRKRYEGRTYDGRDQKIALVSDMLKWSLDYMYNRLGLDGYIGIESEVKPRTVAGLVVPGSEVETFYPVVTVTGRIDKRQQAYLNKGVDVERKVHDAQLHTSKEMADKGFDVGLLQ